LLICLVGEPWSHLRASFDMQAYNENILGQLLSVRPRLYAAGVRNAKFSEFPIPPTCSSAQRKNKSLEQGISRVLLPTMSSDDIRVARDLIDHGCVKDNLHILLFPILRQ
jgi:hypothetical protein